MDCVLKTENLTKRFGSKTAVDGVSMNISRGEIYGFIGKNGAGKTTTMKMILGTSVPTGGKIELFGSTDLNAQRKRIGSLIEAPGLYRGCTAFENMKRFSILCGGDDKEIRELLDFVGLGDTGSKKAGAFSLGMKQRLGIAVALLGSPELLILDEPINGLDPAGIKEIRDLVLKLNTERKITVLVSSHLLDELAKIVTKYGIINGGRLIEEVTADELNVKCKKYLSLRVNNMQSAMKIIRENFPDVNAEATVDGIRVYSEVEDKSELNALLVNAGVRVYELHDTSGGFEDYFIKRTGV